MSNQLLLPAPANVRKPAPKQTLKQYMEKKADRKARRVKRNIVKDILLLAKDMRGAGIKFNTPVNVRGNKRRLTVKEYSGYYGYLVATAKEALKND